MGKRSNPLLWVGYVFAYVRPVQVHPFNYSGCLWYEELKIVYSDKYKVIAYVNGYRTQFDIMVYTFHNIRPNQHAIDRLMNYCRSHPGDYPGWLHHVNFYSQAKRGECLKQIKF